MTKKTSLICIVLLSLTSCASSLPASKSLPDMMAVDVLNPVATISYNTLNLKWDYYGCNPSNMSDCYEIQDGHIYSITISMTMTRISGESVSATILHYPNSYFNRLSEVGNQTSFDLAPYIAQLGWDMLSADITVTFTVLYYNFIWERYGVQSVVVTWYNIPLIVIIIVSGAGVVVIGYYGYRFYSRRKSSKIDIPWCNANATKSGFLEQHPECNKYIQKPEKVKEI